MTVLSSSLGRNFDYMVNEAVRSSRVAYGDMAPTAEHRLAQLFHNHLTKNNLRSLNTLVDNIDFNLRAKDFRIYLNDTRAQAPALAYAALKTLSGDLSTSNFAKLIQRIKRRDRKSLNKTVRLYTRDLKEELRGSSRYEPKLIKEVSIREFIDLYYKENARSLDHDKYQFVKEKLATIV